ncbi:MAG: SRPBCC family protein [Archangium sp.]
MLIATALLFTIGALGAADILFFHTIKGQLTQRTECRKEVVIHVARGFIYAAQFIVIPNYRLTGAWFWALAVLFVIDITIAVTDVWEEPKSRASQGGLCSAEYLMHIVLSVLVGAMLREVIAQTWGDWALPTAVTERDTFNWFSFVMAAGSALVAVYELASLRPNPIHVRVRLDASVKEVWDLTQDHHRHPEWDHRFSHIEMLDEVIKTGTLMKYTKRIGPFLIGGMGRYKLHRLMKQSTFEFWSDERLSLIRRGVGLWLYKELPDGRTEFSTSYTYDVRWGVVGRVIDLVFRPIFQKYTEASFRRLARDCFHAPEVKVLGRMGRLPERFA